MWGVGCAQTEEVRPGCADVNGKCQHWSDITGFWCRPGSVDPGRLSAGYISEVRFGFSAASPFSRHEARDLLPLQLVQIPLEKVKSLLNRVRVHPCRPWGGPRRSHMETDYIYVLDYLGVLFACNFSSCWSFLALLYRSAPPVWEVNTQQV